jgi:hypothetical protein
LIAGTLGTNSRGCIAVSGKVLVVPTGSRLNDDGSIDLGGKHYEQGDTVALGGGNETPLLIARAGRLTIGGCDGGLCNLRGNSQHPDSPRRL